MDATARSHAGRSISLTSSIREAHGEVDGGTWSDAVEDALQCTLREWFERSSQGEHELATVKLLRNLSKVAQRRLRQQRVDGVDVAPELSLFAQPLRMFQFGLYDRRYVSIDVERRNVEMDSAASPEERRANLEKVERLRCALGPRVTWLNRHLRDEIRVLDTRPTTEEPISALIAHLAEGWLERERGPVTLDDASGSRSQWCREVHPTRLGAIRSWETRLRDAVAEQFDHEKTSPVLYAYPYVDLKMVGSQYLLAFAVTPLDLSFVDDKVPEHERLPDIALALYDVSHCGNWAYAALPLLRQAVGRLVFGIRANDNSHALNQAFGELGAIERHWYSVAADQGRILRQLDEAGFDGIAFGEAFVREMLLRVPGVDKTEVFRFDRVFIFRETGTTSEIGDDPMEMLVLETSIKSENPADRGQSLTRRERRLRGTEDFECNPAEKTVQDDDRCRFWLHPHERGIVMSRKSKVSADEKAQAFQRRGRSSVAADAEDQGYGVRIPEDLDHAHPTSRFLVNLLGRLVHAVHVHTELQILDAATGAEQSVTTKTFNREFQERHMKVLQRATAEGLTFEYAHGLDLEADAQILAEIQARYFDYQKERYQVEDRMLMLERAREENLDHEQAERFAALQERRGNLERRVDKVDSAKVLCLSFSWDLHDENMRKVREEERRLRRARQESRVEVRPVLGPEYAFTLVFVSDEDGEKTLPDLERERTDLKAVVQTLLRQIWQSRLEARTHLKRRSDSIGHCLDQFLHRAKGLIPDQAGKSELDDLVKGMQKLLRPDVVRASFRRFQSGPELAADLLRLGRDEGAAAVASSLVARSGRWTGAVGEAGSIDITFRAALPAGIEVVWEGEVVRDAFEVAFKNACEACATADAPRVEVAVESVPISNDGAESKGFVDVVVTNSGGPIPSRLLAKLNSPDPTPVGRNTDKSGSTGIGVFLARYQLRETVGRGADYLVDNLGDGRVCTRIRLPARLAIENERECEVKAPTAVHGPYVLYVEDTPEVYESTRGAFEALLAPLGLALRHVKSLTAAKALVDATLPVLLVTDYQIVKHEDDTTGAGPKYGCELLAHVMSEAARRERRPPIWVVTSELPSEVQSSLPQAAKQGYRFVPDGPEPQPGDAQIVVLADKRPFESEDSGRRFAARVHAELDRGTAERQRSSSEVVHGTGDVAWVKLDDDLPTRLAEAWLRQRQHPRLLVAVSAPANTWDDLAHGLARWFQHPGLRDLDLPGNPQDWPLYDTVRHTRHVLVLQCGPELIGQVGRRLRFWALTRNLLLVARDAAPDDAKLHATWTALRQAGRGPLSTIRHDVQNVWVDPALVGTRKRAVDAARRADVLLAPDAAHIEQLEHLLVRGPVDTDAVREHLRVFGGEAGHGDADVAAALHDLDAALVEAKELRPGLGAERFRWTVVALRDAVWGR